ncbi:MAG: helicase HerA-like domain-containing protein [Christensenellales bacterium]
MLKDGKLWIAKSGDTRIFMEPRMCNRHGMIAGASGTGKTITLKVMAESFSELGVPVFLADIKGDLAGMCRAGQHSESMEKRIARFDIPDWRYRVFPTRFWDIYGEAGHPVRTTVSEMGPELLARLMDLTDVQADVLNIVFHIADDQELLLTDIKDLRAMLRYVSENRAEFVAQYGNMSAQSLGGIQRALLVLEDAGGDLFFGEPAIDIFDWMKTDENGRGYINILHSVKLVQNQTLYATFMLFLMSELFERLPEAGDPEKPKIVFFFDEAHLLFNGAPKVLLQKVEQVVKLIRSKGVGIYFISQSPSDIPDAVLAQLSNRVQHALRAYTPAEQKAVRTAAQTFRPNPNFKTEDVITELGVGEALVSFLDAEGRPGVVERAFILPPQSLMGTITEEQRHAVMEKSELGAKYDQQIDRESAYEHFEALREEEVKQAAEEKEAAKERETAKQEKTKKTTATKKKTTSKTEKALSKATSSAMNTIGREVGKKIVRGLFGSIKW